MAPRTKKTLDIQGVFFTGTSSSNRKARVNFLKSAHGSGIRINVTCSRRADAYLISDAIRLKLERSIVVWCDHKEIKHALPTSVRLIKVPYGRNQIDLVLAYRCSELVICGTSKTIENVKSFAENTGKKVTYL